MFQVYVFGSLAFVAMQCLAVPVQEKFPNDPLYYRQWGHEQINDIDIDISTAWAALRQRQLSTVKVAFVDTDIGLRHEDLNSRRIPGCDIGQALKRNGYDPGDVPEDVPQVDPEDCEPPDDGFPYHGLFTAGIFGAEYNNSIGIAGVTGPFNIELMPLKIRSQSVVDIAAAFKYAAAQGCRIINFSQILWGIGNSTANLVEVATTYAHDMGTLIVQSAGNQGLLNAENYPTKFNLPNVIGVASINQHGDLAADWNNDGVEFHDHSNYGIYAHVAAPGTAIHSTSSPCCPYDSYILDILRDIARGVEPFVPDDVQVPLFGNLGTSLAAPYVSGVAALALAVFPNLPVTELRDSLMIGVQQTEELSQVVYFCEDSPRNAVHETDECSDGKPPSSTRLVQAGGYIRAPLVLEAAAAAAGQTIDLDGVTMSSYPKAAFNVWQNGDKLDGRDRIEKGVEVGVDSVLTFEAIEKPNYSYEWDFGDGSFASGAQMRKYYSSVGTFYPRLIVEDIRSNLKDASAILKVTVHSRNADHIRIRIAQYQYEGYLMTGDFKIFTNIFGGKRISGSGSFKAPDEEDMHISLDLSHHLFGFRTLDYEFNGEKGGVSCFSCFHYYRDTSTATIGMFIQNFFVQIVIVDGDS